MLTNLFSIFDTSLYSFNHFIFMTAMLVLLIMWRGQDMMKSTNKTYVFKSTFQSLLMSQFSNVNSLEMKKENMKKLTFMKMVLVIFLSVLFMNFYSLFPFILSSTSHMSFNMNLTLVAYILSVSMAMKKDLKSFLSHLTPSGTPAALMSFMVIIETISSLIRPITLAVRLMANMVAGHLLLTLLSKFSMLSGINMMCSLLPGGILGILEMGVAFIQAYVITLLITLYLKEAFE